MSDIGNLIFLSYRRADSAAQTLALRLELETQLRAAQVFMDTHAIQGGDKWPDQILEALRVAKVVVPIIGAQWAGSATGQSNRRIDDPGDWVRKELEVALDLHSNAIVPVLVGDAAPLRRTSLPESLQPLADLQPMSIDVSHWDRDVGELLARLRDRFDLRSKASEYRYPAPDPLVAKTIPLAWEVLEKEFARDLPEWRIEFSDDPERLHYKRVELARDFAFGSFRDAMAFMDAASDHAEEVEHHPKWLNLWRTVTVWLTTWDAGHRITILDVQFARYLEREYKRRTQGLPRRNRRTSR